MPGLLDLPPELLEQIYDNLEVKWTDWGAPHRIHVRHLRLTCRYIEKSIRHSFLRQRFHSEIIPYPTDKYIQRFCAVTKTPDLAKSLTHLDLSCADDGTIEQRARQQVKQHNQPCSTTERSELLLSSDVHSLLPAALSRHKDALLAAFIAAENIKELEYKDHHWSLVRRSLKRIWVTEDEEFPPRKKPAPDDVLQKYYVCDISSTFNFYLSLAAQAGLILKCIRVGPLSGEKHMSGASGLTNAIALVTEKSAILQVEMLDLDFVDDWRDDIQSAEEALVKPFQSTMSGASANQNNRATLIGQQLHDCVQNFPILTFLRLCFHSSAYSLTAWKLFAGSGAFPALQHLELNCCKIYLEDFSNFVFKHCNTLKCLVLYGLELEDGSVQDLKDLLGKLRELEHLRNLRVESLRLNGNLIHFPSVSYVIDEVLKDEEEYVMVYLTDFVSIRDPKIREGLTLMVECMKIIAG